MKNEDDIVRAHDLMTSIMLQPVVQRMLKLPEEEVKAMTHATTALCWVLGHEQGAVMGATLKDLEERLAEKGLAVLPVWSKEE